MSGRRCSPWICTPTCPPCPNWSRSGTLDQWITRSVDDNPLKTRLAIAVQGAQEAGRGGDYPDRLAMRIAMALNADGPVVYKHMRFGADGFPNLFADAAVQRKDLQPFAEMINNQAHRHLAEDQGEPDAGRCQQYRAL